MDFPLLKTFQVDSKTIDFLNQKREQYFKEGSTRPAENDIYISDTGRFTHNLVDWDDKEYKQFISDVLLNNISNLLNLSPEKVDLYFQHIFDYKEGGYVKPHNHAHVEDFVVIIYLNTCDKGKTIFYLNKEQGYDTDRSDKIKAEISPIKGNGVCFSSLLVHEAELTSESKKIFVVGVRVNL